MKLPPEQEAIRAKCFHPSATFVEFPLEGVETSIPARFEKIVRLYPDRIAVKTKEQAVTYSELNASANRLARVLVREPAAEAGPVMVMFENGANLLAGMLGVLKAGKSVVLTDPALPKARLLTLIQDCEAAVIITDDQTVSATSELSGLPCRLMTLESIDAGNSQANLNLPVDADAMAFIFYTSGSTGSPKGVVGTHRSFLHNIMLRTNGFFICREDRFSLLAVGTSNAILTAFLPVLNGAMLLPFDISRQGAAPLAKWISAEEITVCWIGSPLFRVLCETLEGGDNFPSLRFAKLSSEALYKKDVELFRKYFSSRTILASGLSTTESGTLRYYFVDHRLAIDGDSVPVGYAVPGKEILLLDDNGKEVNGNEVGEIVVRSRYLSPGYWRRPGLTEAKFKPDPEGGDKHLYYTGDLGLLLPDGCLLHKGRKDFRVKIQGYGVEISEVEKSILKCGGVKEAVVVALQQGQQEARLVAYFTVREPKLTVPRLRAFLKESLPDYMIPSLLVMLDAMPLGRNGKLDRRSLPEPTAAAANLQSTHAAPTNLMQTKLAKIWAEVLRLDQVGIHDNFFHSGGTSLLAMRVVSQVIKHFQLEIPLQSLFESPTVAAMAAVITAHQKNALDEGQLTTLLEELESLSDEEATRRLNRQPHESAKR